ncbi:PqiC family protein [Alteromonas lipolytica]|uniref:ABC-type transport auxiliary lipoprotein component domain-containing protein n=1 Tax=Alteromonas lipolytica TaxID=1856405 RepID=A0A1E8FEP6_9ALTE|nr:ABC-type transport auxiliary lipoprotein family protein [Alteromonas lipolytica]OFI34391.1 hypothetical protein BFC17_18615 [Alteromonas lipolytica]GGF81863.1 hypothetical protein GCM10011338_37630 [Alteromonas lipolytica]
MRNWLLVLLLGALSACSSKPISLNYYLLHDPGQSLSQPSRDISAQPTVFLRTLTVPTYLKQRNLSLQLSASQLHFAPDHLWAEPFDNDLTMAFGEALSLQHSVRLRAQSQWTNPAQTEYILDIQIDDFITTYLGDLVLKGTFRLQAPDSQAPQLIQFNYQLPLESDGFAQAVAQMRILVNQLAKDVVAKLEANSESTQPD